MDARGGILEPPGIVEVPWKQLFLGLRVQGLRFR